MNKNLLFRVNNEAGFILENECTIRQLASKFGVSKSTAHKDLNDRLFKINKEKYYKVKQIFNKHIQERHINGGEATRKKYLEMKGG